MAGGSLVPVFACAAGSGELAEQFGVGQDEPAQQRAVHDGQEIGTREAVQQERVTVLLQCPQQPADRFAHLPLEDRGEQLLPGLPVQVDGALADVGAAGDIVDGHPPVAVAQQEVRRHVQDPRGPCLALGWLGESIVRHLCSI